MVLGDEVGQPVKSIAFGCVCIGSHCKNLHCHGWIEEILFQVTIGKELRNVKIVSG